MLPPSFHPVACCCNNSSSLGYLMYYTPLQTQVQVTTEWRVVVGLLHPVQQQQQLKRLDRWPPTSTQWGCCCCCCCGSSSRSGLGCCCCLWISLMLHSAQRSGVDTRERGSLLGLPYRRISAPWSAGDVDAALGDRDLE